MKDTRALAAEALGTFWLVLGGCGSAVFAANFGPVNSLGIGLLGVSLAFGLTVVTGAYALGHLSGGHFNPAVTVGLWTAKKFEAAKVLPYVAAQVVGAIVASLVLWGIVEGSPGFSRSGNWLAANGFGTTGSPGGYSFASGLIAEVVLTAVFLIVILGVTDRRAPAGFAPLGIGLTLTLIHLISIPITNTSVNPARSTGPALLVGGDNLEQLWFFWLAPIAGAVIGALVHRFISGDDKAGTAEIS
jgi:aquaporin Z